MRTPKNQPNISPAMQELMEQVQTFRDNVDPLLMIELFTYLVAEQQKKDGSLDNTEWNAIHGLVRLLTQLARLPERYGKMNVAG